PSMPAWWTPTPRRSICLSLGPTPSGHCSLSTSALSGAFTPGASRSSPLSISATLQHSSRLKQKTTPAVVRFSPSPLPISTTPPPPGHVPPLLPQELVGHPAEGQRHLALLALDQLQLAPVAALQPGHELRRVADGRRQEQQPDVLGQERQRQLPDDAALHVGEV